MLVIFLVASRGRDRGWWCGDGVGICAASRKGRCCCEDRGIAKLCGLGCVRFDRLEVVSSGVVLVLGCVRAVVRVF